MLQPPSITLGGYLLMVACTHQDCAFSHTPFQGSIRLTQQQQKFVTNHGGRL
jgi:hypothetical protein